jgi:alkylhydroperoxidase family enzyme
MFNISDPHNDLAPDARERIEDLANKMLGSVDEVANDPMEALQALAAVLAFVISEGFLSRKSADQALAVVMMVVVSSMEQAEQDGNTCWSQKTTH